MADIAVITMRNQTTTSKLTTMGTADIAEQAVTAEVEAGTVMGGMSSNQAASSLRQTFSSSCWPNWLTSLHMDTSLSRRLKTTLMVYTYPVPA